MRAVNHATLKLSGATAFTGEGMRGALWAESPTAVGELGAYEFLTWPLLVSLALHYLLCRKRLGICVPQCECIRSLQM